MGMLGDEYITKMIGDRGDPWRRPELNSFGVSCCLLKWKLRVQLVQKFLVQLVMYVGKPATVITAVTNATTTRTQSALAATRHQVNKNSSTEPGGRTNATLFQTEDHSHGTTLHHLTQANPIHLNHFLTIMGRGTVKKKKAKTFYEEI